MKYDFNLQNAQFYYEPFPICYVPNLLDKAEYEALRENYPDINLFEHKPVLGDKYSLSELNNKDNYHKFVSENPIWGKFFAKIKSKEFIEETLVFLKAHNIDMGINKFVYLPKRKKFKNLRIIKLRQKQVTLTSRFEFSVMKANGGNITPHTDAPNKIITLVISFIGENEWNSEWGGGTDVLIPTDRTKLFNHVNKQMPFDKMEYVRTFPFNPNQLVLFIKTYNSWHSVTPIKGPETGLRKTLTINIERVV